MVNKLIHLLYPAVFVVLGAGFQSAVQRDDFNMAVVGIIIMASNLVLYVTGTRPR